MPESPLIIVNPAAGAGRAARLLPWLRERLARRPDARLEVTRRSGDAEEWAASGAGQHDRVVAVGGDGTVQEVVNGLLADGTDGPTATLGVVPVGSGNDLARSLGLPGEAGEAWSAAIGSRDVALDVLHARGEGRSRWFASAGGVGLDAQVAAAMVDRRPWQRGRIGYLVTALAHLGGYRNRPVTITVDDEPPIERRILLVAIANGAFYGGGMQIAPDATTDDGTFDVCIVGDIGKLAALGQLPNLYRGRHIGHPCVEMRRATRIEVGGDGATLAHLDGEPFGPLPLRVDLHPGALRVAVPVR